MRLPRTAGGSLYKVALLDARKRFLSVVNVGTDQPKVAVRESRDDAEYQTYRHVDILGPSRLWETDVPLPGSNGKAICVLETDAMLRVYTDG